MGASHHKIFAGDHSLFDAAKLDGEIYEGKNGKWFYDETHNSKE